MTDLVLPANLQSIGESAFAGCVLPAKLVLPDSLTETGENVFAGCDSLQEVYIGKGLKIIQSGVFQMCEGLTYVYLPQGVEMIGHATFRDCSSLTGIALPASITFIGYEAFGGRIGLQEVYYGGTTSQWNKIEFYRIYFNDGNSPLHAASFTYQWDGWAEEGVTVSVTVPGGAEVTILLPEKE